MLIGFSGGLRPPQNPQLLHKLPAAHKTVPTSLPVLKLLTASQRVARETGKRKNHLPAAVNGICALPMAAVRQTGAAMSRQAKCSLWLPFLFISFSLTKQRKAEMPLNPAWVSIRKQVMLIGFSRGAAPFTKAAASAQTARPAQPLAPISPARAEMRYSKPEGCQGDGSSN